jgi:molybdopterin synthase sulfur carrier subunit|tara:strand:- start:918 stop:1196 length:279 start_codon:yes stop_codon:yes gene_type:complete
MDISVRIPTPLRRLTNGQDKVALNSTNIKNMVDDLEKHFPGMEKRLCDDEGNLRNFVNVYINGEDVRFLNGIDTALKDGDEISLVPAVAGGN